MLNSPHSLDVPMWIKDSFCCCFHLMCISEVTISLADIAAPCGKEDRMCACEWGVKPITVYVWMYVWMCVSAGNQLPSPSYTAEKTEQTQQLPLSMDQLLGTSSLVFRFCYHCMLSGISQQVTHCTCCFLVVISHPGICLVTFAKMVKCSVWLNEVNIRPIVRQLM